MGLISDLRDKVGHWRSTDPYHYECTVCERAFPSEQSSCPECGGDVERVSGAIGSETVDPHPWSPISSAFWT